MRLFFRMEGLYVDSKYCLQIITTPHRVDETTIEWLTYKSESESYEGSVSKIYNKSSSSLYVHLELDDSRVDGVYDGVKRINWDNGDRWNRVNMSYHQYGFLTRRMYTPLTFLFAAFVYSIWKTSYSYFAYMWHKCSLLMRSFETESNMRVAL